MSKNKIPMLTLAFVPTEGQLAEYGLTLDEWGEIVRWCEAYALDTYDRNSGVHNPTLLAEIVVEYLDEDGWDDVYEWLDDETHPIWEAAWRVCERADAGELDE